MLIRVVLSGEKFGEVWNAHVWLHIAVFVTD
jgi:hypothetical protein